jgi:hypothetical protein
MVETHPERSLHGVTVAVSSHIDNVRPRTCRSGWGPTGDGRAGLLAFLIHEVGDGSGEALALVQHAAQDQQTANTASDGDNEEQPKDGVVAHSAILLTRTSLATGELRIHPPVVHFDFARDQLMLSSAAVEDWEPIQAPQVDRLTGDILTKSER